MLIFFLIILLAIICFNKKGIPVFLYHNIDDTKGVSQTYFEEHLKIMSKCNVKTYKFEDIKNGQLDKNSAMITFDDGYLNNYTKAYPLLKKYNTKATIFLNTKYIGQNIDYMNWDQIREMYESGLIDFQLHTHSHNKVISNPLKLKGKVTNKDLEKKELKKIYNGEMKVGEPLFQFRGELSEKGYFLTQNYFNERDNFINKTIQETNKLFKENEKRYINEYTTKEYEERIDIEINENKKIIYRELNKESNVFAWPWGHRNKFDLKVFETNGINTFVTTKKGTNYYRFNNNKIRRIELKKYTPINFKIIFLINRNFVLGKIYELFS